MDNKDLITLDTPLEELEDKLLQEKDIDNVKNIIDIFNLNIKKKNVIRANKLAELQDSISEQMQKRIESNADAFSNDDLLNYFKTVQQTIEKSDTSSDDVRVPIQITQQQINITDTVLDRDSKQRVISAIQSILAKQENSQQLEEVEVVDVVSEESIEQSNEE